MFVALSSVPLQKGTTVYTVSLSLQKQHSTLSTILHSAEYKTICAVSPPIPSQIFVLKGLANLLATMHLSSIAEWLTIVGKKQRRGGQACFSAPIPLQEFSAFDFFFFQ